MWTGEGQTTPIQSFPQLLMRGHFWRMSQTQKRPEQKSGSGDNFTNGGNWRSGDGVPDDDKIIK